MEELQSALQAWGLTVSNLPGKGRSLITTRDFCPGEVIVREEPYVCVPRSSPGEYRCDGCFTSSNLKKCSACQVVWYCGRTCQKLEWKLHRQECQSLRKLDKDRVKFVTPSIRSMVKLYIRWKLQSEKEIPATAADNYKLVEAMVSHMSQLDEKQLGLYAQKANFVHLILQWPEIQIKEIAENFSKFACNGHTILNSELNPLGTGLYPIISITNHSCLPNAVLLFEGRQAVVRALRHIPKNSEVSNSYIETAESTAARQKILKEQYFFTCSCPLCIKQGQDTDIQESAILEGYTCKDEECSGFLLHDSDSLGFVCQSCGMFRSKHEIAKMESDMKILLDKATTLASSGNPQEVLRIYKEIEKLQTKLCHPFSISLLQTREKILEVFLKPQISNYVRARLVQLGQCGEALEYCRSSIRVYQRLYQGVQGVHPLLGIRYYVCGNIEWFLGDKKSAVKSFTKAAEILRITHGTETPFMKEVLMKVEEARASYRASMRRRA